VLSAEKFWHSVAVVDKDGNREQVVTEKDTQGSRVFAGMLNHSARAVGHLTRGFETMDLPLISWAARNLVELRIWSRYASLSKESMQRFAAKMSVPNSTTRHGSAYYPSARTRRRDS
jgi:hypothetical protein